MCLFSPFGVYFCFLSFPREVHFRKCPQLVWLNQREGAFFFSILQLGPRFLGPSRPQTLVAAEPSEDEQTGENDLGPGERAWHSWAGLLEYGEEQFGQDGWVEREK